MASIKEAAEQLEVQSMKNISELDEVPTDIEINEETRENSIGETYLVRYAEVNGEKYRIPFTVLKNLKAILLKKPDLKKFSVARTGSTKEDTSYTVIPL